MSSPRHIAVLGGGGFLGSHLVQGLLSRPGIEGVRVLDTGFAKLEAQDARLQRIEGSVADPAALERVVAGCDVVCSLTALCNPSLYNTRPREVIEASFTDLVPLVDLCTTRGLWLVHFSTCEVYGKPWPGDAAMHEARSPLVLGPVQAERWSYACAKQLLERLIWAEQRHAGLRATVVRPFNVIGPRMDFIPGRDGEGVPRVLACFMAALLRQQPLQLVDGGRRRRAFIAAQDFTEAVLRVLEQPTCQGEILNIGHPENDVSIAALARQMVALYAQRHGGDPRLPCETVAAETFYGPGYDDAEHRVPDITRARALLGWAPRLSLDDMLPGIIDDYVARYGKEVG